MSQSVLAIDDSGCVDASRLRAQQHARIETVLAPVFADPDRDAKVIEAGRQFIAHGSTWTPSPALARAIDDAALGRRKCPRLRWR